VGRFPASPIVGVLLLGLLIPASAAMSQLVLMTAATLALVTVAAREA
jgi:hypothetical protein